MSEVRQIKIKFSDLKFLDDNPRTITREDLERLAGRIKDDPTFFDNRPCLVNFIEGRYICYAGFQRAHAAAKVLKWKEIPCSVENDVPMDLMRRRAIYDNTHDGEWNSEVLSSWEFEVEEYRDMGVPEWVFGGADEDSESESAEQPGRISKGEARKSLAERFIIPPFSVFDTRQGYWQSRKRQWLSLGIKSELGRGGAMTYNDHEWQREKLGKVQAFTGGADIRRNTAERETNNETAGQIRNRGGGQKVKMAMHNDPKQRKNKYDGKG